MLLTDINMLFNDFSIMDTIGYIKPERSLRIRQNNQPRSSFSSAAQSHADVDTALYLSY